MFYVYDADTERLVMYSLNGMHAKTKTKPNTACGSLALDFFF